MQGRPASSGIRAILLGLALALTSTCAFGQGAVRTRTLTGIAAMRYLLQRRRYADAERVGYTLLWKDIRRAEPLYWLGGSLAALGRKEEAAVFYTLLLRVLRDGPKAEVAKYQRKTELRLKDLNRAHELRRAEYARTAAGKRFESAAQVGDLWMTQAEADLHGLHGLYAWKLVGGRKKGVKPDWIHNAQGRMHRSGMKYCQQVDGRKGILFSVPIKAHPDKEKSPHHHAALERLGGHPTQIRIRNPGSGRFLRVGTKAYGFPYVLKVYVNGKRIFARNIGTKQWADLKIDLSQPADRNGENGTPQEGQGPTSKPASRPVRQVICELVVPDEQRWSEGVWIDYLDFFDN